MGVGRRGGKDYLFFFFRGSIFVIRFIGKDCLILKISVGWVKCRRVYKLFFIVG